MKKLLKPFLTKLRVRRLLLSVVKLSSEAYSTNKSIQASDLPDVVKQRSAAVLDAYVDFCAALGVKSK